MSEVKRKIEITQEEYEDLFEALHQYRRKSIELGYTHVAARYNVLITKIDDQIGEQGGFEE